MAQIMPFLFDNDGEKREGVEVDQCTEYRTQVSSLVLQGQPCGYPATSVIQLCRDIVTPITATAPSQSLSTRRLDAKAHTYILNIMVKVHWLEKWTLCNLITVLRMVSLNIASTMFTPQQNSHYEAWPDERRRKYGRKQQKSN
ncbi:hypothetical protein I7I51_03930 [Histoplasma capsulatum]|uniref:Uncharacterized protein n=1 Tax=Ajellomyces capsulatus TaxID=5037 RepID=A0A8A1MAL3_AJECA|nr:hypothetical protein I7I51_03930 [Histoplasma capsulatum]